MPKSNCWKIVRLKIRNFQENFYKENFSNCHTLVDLTLLILPRNKYQQKLEFYPFCENKYLRNKFYCLRNFKSERKFLRIRNIMFTFSTHKTVYVRPWLKLNGELNGVLLKRFQEIVLTYIQMNPGCLEVRIGKF